MIRALGLIARLTCAVLDRIERVTGVHDDDLEAIIRATAEVNEPTPIGDAALAAVIANAIQIELAVEDFAAEIAANADEELQELLEGDQQ